MSEGFKSGDVVRLKSGGPEMTVRSLRGDGIVLCTWFDMREALKEESLPQVVLKAAVPFGQQAEPDKGEAS